MTTPGVREAGNPRPKASQNLPDDMGAIPPSPINCACQVHTTGFDLPERRMISPVPKPSAVARMMWARHTCFCGALRSDIIALSVSRDRGSVGRALQRATCPIVQSTRTHDTEQRFFPQEFHRFSRGRCRCCMEITKRALAPARVYLRNTDS